MFALALIDASVLRAHWQKKVEKKRRELERERMRIEEFERNGPEEYRIWLHQTLPAEMTEIRELEERIHDLERIRVATQLESKWMKIPKHRAYARVRERWEKQAPLLSDEVEIRKREHEARVEAEESAREERMKKGEYSYEEKLEMLDDYRAALKETLGARVRLISDEELMELLEEQLERHRQERIEEEEVEFARDSNDQDYDSSQQPIPKPEPLDEEGASDLKRLYRELAKKLHPDVAKNLTANDRKLWSEVQEAYGRLDVARLRALKTLLQQNADPGTDASTSISDLRELVQEMTKTLASLKKRQESRSDDPVWIFFQRKSDRKFLREWTERIRAEFARRRYHLVQAKQQLQSSIDRLAREPRPKSRRRR